MAYAFQATVTVPAPTGGPHTDFTFLLRGSDTLLKLASLGTGGAIQNATTRLYTGYSQNVPADLVLSTDAGASSLMTWGIDNWDQANGIVWIWVKIASYSAGFTIYVSIGNPLITNYQGGAIGSEYDAFTQAAYHFPDGSSLAVADFVNAFAGTNHSATATTGKIDGAAASTGSSGTPQYITNSGITLAAGWSVELWANPTSFSGFKSMIGGQSGTFGLRTANTSGKVFGTKTATADDTVSTVALTINTWNHIIFTQTSLGAYNYYINGAAAGTFSSGGQVPTNPTTDIFRGENGGEFFPGSLDELRFISTVRSSDYAATSFANQNNPPLISAFASLGGVSELSLLGAG